MTLSKNHIKLITSLSQKKYRQKHNLFVVEGVKAVQEFLQSSYSLHLLFTEDIESFPEVNSSALISVSSAELSKISQLKTPNKVLAIFEIPESEAIATSGLIVALDAVNDPGNLGTIIRLCDWFGVRQLWCSTDTVDCYNPKVVQATMGSLSRVHIVYDALVPLLNATDLPLFAADMEGANVYKQKLPDHAVLVMGNEANGISEEVQKLMPQFVTIPKFGTNNKTESLNVATATAILLSEFRR